MAKFLNTSATNYFLEELIKQARERLIIISPFLRFNDRIKELLEDKDRLKLDVRLVFGKSELAPQEINWLRGLEFVRTSFCQNLHAKCYMNERAAIITSMNLYDFSQVNNNEMGVYVDREAEPDLYRETYEEAQRLIRISERVRLSAEMIEEAEEPSRKAPQPQAPQPAQAQERPPQQRERKAPGAKAPEKLSTSRLAKAHNMETGALVKQLLAKRLVTRDGKDLKLTDAGRQAGGEARASEKFGAYLIWPADLPL